MTTIFLFGCLAVAQSLDAQTLAPPLEDPFGDDPAEAGPAEPGDGSEVAQPADAGPLNPEAVEVQDVETDAFIGLVGEDVPNGIKVLTVNERGPAEQAGVQAGDIIVGFHGRSINNSEEVATALASLRPGQQVQVVVNRNGRVGQLALTLGSRYGRVLSARTAPNARAATPSAPASAVRDVAGPTMTGEPEQITPAPKPEEYDPAVDATSILHAARPAVPPVPTVRVPTPQHASDLLPDPLPDATPALDPGAADPVPTTPIPPAPAPAIAEAPEPTDAPEEIPQPAPATDDEPVADDAPAIAMPSLRPPGDRPLIYMPSQPGTPAVEIPLPPRASLGVDVVDITPETALRYGPAVRQGIIIEAVKRGSAADRASLMAGTIITAIEGQPVATVQDLYRELETAQVGQPVEVTYQLGDQQKTVSVTLGPVANDERPAPSMTLAKATGMDSDDAASEAPQPASAPRTIEIVRAPAAAESASSSNQANEELRSQYEALQVEMDVLRQTMSKMEARLRMMEKE